MTITDTVQSTNSEGFKEASLSYADLAKQKVRSRGESLVERIKETCTVIFLCDEIPNTGYFNGLKDRITTVNSKLDIDILLDDSRSEVKFYVKNYLKELRDISLEEWPLAYQHAIEQANRTRERMAFAKEEFRGYFDFSDALVFEEYLQKVDEILADAKQKLIKATNSSERNDLIQNTMGVIKEVREDTELHIAKFSVPHTKDEIINRISEIFDEFELLDLEIEEETVQEIERETPGLLENKERKAQLEVIASQLDRLQEIDTEVEKKYLIRLIQQKYEELVEIVIKLQSDGLSLSSEVRYAKSSVEGSKKRIEGMSIEASPTSLNQISQLYITKKGTLNTLAHTLKEVFVKYGEHTVGNAINLLPFGAALGWLEGIGHEEKKALRLHREQLVEQARQDLTWGDDKNEKKVPPILPEEKIEEIIDKHLDQASKSIYLAYAEQRISKYLKFCLLRKSFEGFSDEQKQAIENKTVELIDATKEILLTYLHQQTPPRVSITEKNAKVTGEFKVDEMKVEKIISNSIQELHSFMREQG
jgi:hypothetical protein